MVNDTPKRDRIAATTFSEDDLRRIIEDLHTGRAATDGGAATKGRFKELHEEVRVRDQHFYAAKEAAPKFLPPFENAQTFQSDAIRRTYAKGRSRIVEHPPKFHVEPAKDQQKWRDAANALEEYFTAGYRECEERAGYRIQGHLYHGQAIHYAGVLHWRKYDADQPEMPDADEYDDEPEERDRFEEQDGRYVETAQSRLERYKQMRADAPFPWIIEVPRSDTVGFVEDRSLASGMALFATVTSIGILPYRDKLRDNDHIVLSVHAENHRIKIYQEGERPEPGEPSGSQVNWGDLRVAYIQTRDEWYEMACYGPGNDWTLVKSGHHRYGMPSFVLAKAMETNHPDPLYRWQPWLLGMFRTKPQYDYERSLGRLLAEQTAIPRYWIEKADGQPALDDRGNRIILTGDAAIAEIMPTGSKLVKADLTIDPAFVQFLTASKEDLAESEPETGFIDIGASTQPHTVVAAQAQSNTEIAELKGEQARALRIAFQNIVHCMAKEAEEEGMPAVIRQGDGTILEIEPEMLRGMTVEVTIEPNSGAQQVSRNEYLRGLLNDPKAMMTVRTYLEETGDEDPDATISSWIAERAEISALPQIIQQELAKRFGDSYVLTPGGTAVGFDGQPADPWVVLAEQGFTRPPAAPGAQPGMTPLAPTTPDLQPMDNPAAMAGIVQ